MNLKENIKSLGFYLKIDANNSVIQALISCNGKNLEELLLECEKSVNGNEIFSRICLNLTKKN
jgi:hypothetical protein